MNRQGLLCLPTRRGADGVRRVVDEEDDDPLELLERDRDADAVDGDDDDRSEFDSGHQ